MWNCLLTKQRNYVCAKHQISIQSSSYFDCAPSRSKCIAQGHPKVKDARVYWSVLEYVGECLREFLWECLWECLCDCFRQLCDSIAQVCFLPTESSQAVVPNDFEYHLGTMWFRKASRLVRLLITLIEETAQAPGKLREETHGNTS